jgi:hypothetical protein
MALLLTPRLQTCGRATLFKLLSFRARNDGRASNSSLNHTYSLEARAATTRRTRCDCAWRRPLVRAQPAVPGARGRAHRGGPPRTRRFAHLPAQVSQAGRAGERRVRQKKPTPRTPPPGLKSWSSSLKAQVVRSRLSRAVRRGARAPERVDRGRLDRGSFGLAIALRQWTVHAGWCGSPHERQVWSRRSPT